MGKKKHNSYPINDIIIPTVELNVLSDAKVMGEIEKIQQKKGGKRTVRRKSYVTAKKRKTSKNNCKKR